MFKNIQEKVIKKQAEKGLNKIQENFFALEEQMITIQKNQVEFEKYLKQILEKVEKIEKR